MLQLSAWLVVMGSVLGAVEPGSSDDEGSNIAADVFAAVDADKDGVLKHPETTAARKKVADKMQATLRFERIKVFRPIQLHIYR